MSRVLNRALPTAFSAPQEKLVVVAVALVVAMGLRSLLSPWLGNAFPLVFAFPMVALVSLLAGVGAAGALALLCLAWVWVPFMPPSWPAQGPMHILVALVALAATSFVGLVRAPAARAAPAPDGRAHPALRALRWSLPLALLLPLTLFALLAWNSYQDALLAARQRVEATVRVVGEHAARVVESNQIISEQLLQLLGDDDAARVRARERELHERLARLVRDLPQLQSIWIWDASGRPLVSHRFYPAPPGLDVSDRAYFRHHQERSGSGWYVTEALSSRTTGEPFFDVTHARRSADGRFLGVISVSLRPSYFTDFYRDFVRAEPGLALALLREDGAVLAGWPGPRPAGGARLDEDSTLLAELRAGRSQGWVQARSPVDGLPRMIWFRRVDGHPLAVCGALDPDAVLADWAGATAALGALTFGGTLALLLVLWIALRRTQHEVAALERLQAESAQRLRAEEALRQAQKLEALGRLTGGVAHDFNNLLTVVNNHAFLLRRRVPDGAHDAQVAGILRAVQAGEKLTRQLLAFSRRQSLRPEVVELQEALPGLLDLLSTTLGRRVDIRIEVAPDTPAIQVDRAELELALLNLALNARDAMAEAPGQQTPRLDLTGRRALPEELARLLGGRPADGAYALIRMSDTGSGIDPAIAERVFEPFFTTKPPGEGTGLGLSQVYGFCVQAGGNATVDSAPGRGTTVTLALPAARQAAATADRLPAAPAPGTLQARVLLVEDNKEVATTTAALLSGFGAQVVHAADARSALDRIEAERGAFDVVLSDIAMPGGLSGLDLARTLRGLRPTLPVLLMTGYADEIRHAVAANLPVMSKPCAPADLVAALRSALGQRRAAH